MAAVTVPSRGSLLGSLGGRLKSLRARAAGLVRPVRAPLANLASMPLHVAGLACMDVSAFAGSPIAGWAVTGLSLIWLEHVIADER